MSTHALDRAKRELGNEWTDEQAETIARDVVSAALHDPDDDVIAQTIDAHRAIWIPGLECSCQRWPFDESDDQTMQGFAHHQADAVRAAILGETKNNEREN